jgi:hypothetical protein
MMRFEPELGLVDLLGDLEQLGDNIPGGVPRALAGAYQP